MRKIARERGTAAGSWIVDGNTTAETARAILAGYDNGDPAVMDMAPAPLSGEWAGESIPEIFGLAVGEEWPDDDTLTEFEVEFSDAFWGEVIRAATVAAVVVD